MWFELETCYTCKTFSTCHFIFDNSNPAHTTRVHPIFADPLPLHPPPPSSVLPLPCFVHLFFLLQLLLSSSTVVHFLTAFHRIASISDNYLGRRLKSAIFHSWCLCVQLITCYYILEIVFDKLIKRHSKSKRRAPDYSWALHHIRVSRRPWRGVGLVRLPEGHMRGRVAVKACVVWRGEWKDRG